jgi:DNA processing protein
MVEGIEDILEELGPLYRLQQDLAGPAMALPASDSPLLTLLGYEVVAVDELVLTSGMDTSRVLAELTALELEGLVERCPGGYIRR